MMTGRHHVYAYARFLCAVGALSLLTACAGQSWTRPAIPPMENQPPVKVADVDILKVSSEMIEFAEQHAPRNLKHANKAFNLAYASLDRNFLNFRYDPSVTLSAEDAFRLKQGNCLSFSSMIVAMARAAGLVAWYQEVDVPQEWSSINETLLVARHVTAVVEDQHLEYVVDISRKYNEQDRKNRDHFGTYHWRRKISDKEALAQFYNNLGVDALIDGQLGEAHAWFVKALDTDHDAGFVWSNLGVVYRRNSQDKDAETSYKVALELDSRNSTALNNLYALYVEQGNEAAASDVQAQVERYRRKNPYYLQQLSTEAMEQQRYKAAIGLIQRALKIKEEEYRFHLTLARAQLLSGDKAAAESSLDRARQLAPPDSELDSLSLSDPDRFIEFD
jgi:Flp pilus assembly protein TadD